MITARRQTVLSRFVPRVVLVVAMLAGLSVAGSPDGSLPAPVRNLFGSCAEAAAGTVNVAIAVDPGVLPGAPRGPETLCVTVSEGATGAEVLVERARLLGRPAPRWAPSGLMCAIDGYPATGCGERVDGSYRYWSYHLGDEGSWSYARTGPAMRRATATRMEGWHYIAGANSPVDPPPRVSPSSSTVCPPPPPPAPAVAAGTGAGAGAGAGAVAGAGDGSGGTGQVTNPDGTVGPGGGTSAINGSGIGSTSGSGQTPGSGSGASAGDPGAIGNQPGPGDDGQQGQTSSGSNPSGDDTMAAGRGPAMAAARTADATEATGVPVAVVLMVVVVASLGVGAIVRSRRRSAL